jgi:excisionase family DNA binding protein
MSVPSTALSDDERKARGRNGSRGARDPPNPMSPLTVKECAAILKVNPKTVYEGIRKGQIPAIRVSKLFLIPRPVFERMLRDGAAGTEAA